MNLIDENFSIEQKAGRQTKKSFQKFLLILSSLFLNRGRLLLFETPCVQSTVYPCLSVI